MKNFRTALFYLSFSACILAAGFSTAQTEDKQGNRNPQEVSEQAVNPALANKPQAILFKIHDIKPILNSDGVVMSCEYTATFYNRTPLSLRQAKLDFGWTDEISDLFPIDETAPAEKTEDKPSKNAPKVESLGTIQSSVDVPALGSLKQVSVRGTAQTDKCFALFDTLKFKVSNCNVLNQESSPENRPLRVNGGDSSCTALFTYVNSEHPEYYGEFKAISYEEQIQQEKTQEEKEQEIIDSVNKKISTDLTQTDTIVSNIK